MRAALDVNFLGTRWLVLTRTVERVRRLDLAFAVDDTPVDVVAAYVLLPNPRRFRSHFPTKHLGGAMLRTIEAVIGPGNRVQLLEDAQLADARRALVTVLDEPADEAGHTTSAQLSEAALAEHWDTPAEDAAWAHLQPGA